MGSETAMRKGIKILGKVLSWIIVAIVGLPVAAALLLNVGTVQNFAVRKATELLSRKLETTVSIDRIRLRGFSRLVAEGLYIEDYTGDTMLYAKKLGAAVSKSALLHKKIIIGDVFLDEAKIYLYTPRDGELNIAQLISRLGSDTTKQKSSTRLAFRDLWISDSRFMFRNEGADTLSQGVNFGNMVFDGLDIRSDGLDIDGGTITMDIASMSFRDISGFTVRNLSTDQLTVGDGLIALNGTRIVTPRSDLSMPVFRMDGGNWEAMADILDSVRFDVRLEHSTLSTRTLAYFVPSLGTDEGLLLRNATVDFGGTINDFKVKLALLVGDREAEIGLDAALANVTDIGNATFDIDITRLVSSGSGVDKIAGALLPDSLPRQTAEMIARAGNFSLTAKASGRTTAFGAELSLHADAGTVTVSGHGGMHGEAGTDFDAHVTVNGVDAGRVTGNDLLGKVIADMKAQGHAGKEGLSVNGSLFVPMAEFNGYTYSQLMASGSYAGKQAMLNVMSGDPKLLFTVNGSADFRNAVPAYNAEINLRRADLHSLNVNRKDSIAILSGRVRAKGSGTNLDNINGEILLSNLRYTSSTDDVQADTILFTGRNSDESKYLAMSSSFADVEFKSGISYKEIFNYLNHILYDYLPALDATGGTQAAHRPGDRMLSGGAPTAAGPLSVRPATGTSAPPRIRTDRQGHTIPVTLKRSDSRSELHLDIKAANNIAAIFLPGFSIAEGTKVDAEFNPMTERFSVTANSDYIEYADFFVTKLGFTADNTSDPGAIALRFTTEDLYLPGFSMPSNDIAARVADDRIEVNANISNSTSDLNAVFDVQSLLSRTEEDKELRIGLLFKSSSHIMTGKQRWNISSNLIEYTPKRITIDDFLITSGAQKLHVDGTLAGGKDDTLRLALDEFSIRPLNSIAGLPEGTVRGSLDGSATLISGMKDPILIADIMMDSLSMNGYTAPRLRLNSAWDFATERAGLSLVNTADGKTLVRGFYRPDTNSYAATVDIDGIPLAAANPFLPADVIHSVEGTTALYLELRGSKGMPKMNGTLSVSDFSTTIGITDVTYSTPTLDIDIDGGTVRLPLTTLTDGEGNKATLEAQADISNTSNIAYSARLIPSNIMAIDTKARANDQFYGKVYISGAVNVKGNRNGINVDVAVTTQPGSAFYLPLSNKSNMSEADWIVFESRQPENAAPENVLELKKQLYERSMTERTKRKEKVNLNLNVSLNVNPGLLLSIIIDPATNMTVNARGTAALNVLLNPGTGELSIFGTYEIAEGDFLFSMQPIISNKKFILQQGGTIQFSGDPMDAMLNIEAVYRVRASLQQLASSLQGTGINTGTRVPVDCIVRISESLRKPNLTFDIRIPSADADIQNVLSGALASNEDRALNFLWLVGFGSFAPNGSTASDTDATSAGATLGLNFLSNQLSNLISTNDLNIMLNYRPQDQTSSEEVDFGFSYNIGGNDRLILEVEGNYNADNNMRNNANITGDASLTWIITPAGNVSLKAFTRTINRYDENQGLQENGIGIYYKEDFNVFSDIVRQSRARKEARRRKRAEKEAAKAGSAEQPAAPTTGTAPLDAAPNDGNSRPAETQQPAKSRIEQRREESEERRRRMREEMQRRREEEARTTAAEEPAAPAERESGQ